MNEVKICVNVSLCYSHFRVKESYINKIVCLWTQYTLLFFTNYIKNVTHFEEALFLDHLTVFTILHIFMT